MIIFWIQTLVNFVIFSISELGLVIKQATYLLLTSLLTESVG